MKLSGFIALFLLLGCGGGGGSGGGTPGPVANPNATGAAAGSSGVGVSGGDSTQGTPATCSTLECLSSDYTRSVLDNQKFVKRCAEGLLMVDDVCSEPRAVVTSSGDFDFGNVSSAKSLFKGNMSGVAEVAEYLRIKDPPVSDFLYYEYFISDDSEATNRWNNPGIWLHDGRSVAGSHELSFGVTGFFSNPIGMKVNLLGVELEGVKTYTEMRNFCSSLAEKYALLQPDGSLAYSPLSEKFIESGMSACTMGYYTEPLLNNLTFHFFCKNSEQCVIKSVSIRRAS